MIKKLLLLVLALILSVTPVLATGLPVRSADPIGTEVIDARTRSSKTTDLGGGKYAFDASIGAIHYEDNGWQEIDSELVLGMAPWDWVMVEAGYKIGVNEDFTAGQIIQFWKQGSFVNLQPMALEWTNDLDMLQQVSMPQDVAAVITNPIVDLLPAVGVPSHQGQISWEDAYGSGIDFDWQTTATRLQKRLTIGDFADLPPPAQYIQDGGNPALRYNLIFAPSRDVDIYINDALWNQSSKQQTFDIIEFRKDGAVLWGFMPLRYWGSSDDGTNEGQSVATLEKRGNKLYISIRVPYSWLQTATYPVFIDTDVDAQPSVSSDDTIRAYDPSGWVVLSPGYYAGRDGAYIYALYDLGSGVRFRNIDIPSDSTIGVANLVLTARTSISNTVVNTRIRAESNLTPSGFGTSADFDARTWTTEYINWDAIAAWTKDVEYTTPDFAAVVQEVADLGEITHLVILWDDWEKRSTQSNGRVRIGYTYDSSPAKSPQLHIEYSAGGVSLPTVTTQAGTNVEDTTATGNGNITALGGENADRRGIVWDLATYGDPGNVSPAVSDYDNDVGTDGSFGTGAFTESLTSLPTGDTIYARAYAHNTAGYAYGAEVSFLTKPAAPTNVAATENQETKVVITWTKSTGATDYHVWRDAVDLGASGDVATEDDAGATAGTITNAGTVTASDGSSTAFVTLSLAGEATGHTSHTYKVVASNATGDSDDSATDPGWRITGAITYQWQDDDGGWANIVGGTTDPYNNTGAGAPTITPGAATASDGTSATLVTLSIAGDVGNNGTTLDYRVIVSATNTSNSPQTSDINNGYRGTDTLTYEWFRSATDADAAYGSILGEGGTTDPYNDTNGVVTPDGRWYYAEVSMADAATQDTTHNRGYKAAAPPAPAPTPPFISDGLEGRVALALLMSIGAILTFTMFVVAQPMLGFACSMFWAISGASAYALSSTSWDVYYLIFIACLLGMTVFTMLAAFGLLEKRDTLGDKAIEGRGEKDTLGREPGLDDGFEDEKGSGQGRNRWRRLRQ